MLGLPEKGALPSKTKHNCDVQIFCDWIEGTLLFSEGRLSGSDILDFLHENSIYTDQDFTWEFINDLFSEITHRQTLLGEGYPFAFTNSKSLKVKGKWEDYIPYAFCLVLSLVKPYPKWARKFGADFTEQGALFELFSADALKHTFAGWTVHSTGWGPATAAKLPDIVAELTRILGEDIGNVERWTKKAAKEVGLDLVCFRSFDDGRPNQPTYFLQCASGKDWVDKLKSPDLDRWGNIITFTVRPNRAVVMPFTVDNDDFRIKANTTAGLLLDRLRLLGPGRLKRDWLDQAVSKKVEKWLKPRIKALPVT
jgi:hypothetical protein